MCGYENLIKLNIPLANKMLLLAMALRRLEGQLSVLPNFTNSPKLFHIIKDFNLNTETIFKSTSFQNILQLKVMHIKS